MREPDLRDERWFGFPRFFYVPLVKERVIAKPVRGSPGRLFGNNGIAKVV